MKGSGKRRIGGLGLSSLATQAGGAQPHRARQQRGRLGMREVKGRTDFSLHQGEKEWVWDDDEEEIRLLLDG